ncbi:MAG: Rv3654c family TadE-like protein [Actinomycetes bacterium]
MARRLTESSRPAASGRRRRVAADRGSATVLAITVIMLVTLAGLAGVTLGSALVARHRTAAAADLAALAGAARAAEGQTAACAQARAVATANRAGLTSCRVAGQVVEVVAVIRLPPLFGVPMTARTRARAGPVIGSSS